MIQAALRSCNQSSDLPFQCPTLAARALPAGLQHLRHELIDDVASGGYCFTDGCGMMPPRLADLLRRRLRVVVHGLPYHFSALQMRYG